MYQVCKVNRHPTNEQPTDKVIMVFETKKDAEAKVREMCKAHPLHGYYVKVKQ